MKEQIYFVAKNREQLTSEIYSLSDFPEVRYETTQNPDCSQSKNEEWSLSYFL